MGKSPSKIALETKLPLESEKVSKSNHMPQLGSAKDSKQESRSPFPAVQSWRFGWGESQVSLRRGNQRMRECEQRHSSHQSIKCSNSNEEQPILERKTEEKDIVQILNGNEIKLSDSKC